MTYSYVVGSYVMSLASLILLISSTIIIQNELLLAKGQEEQNNATTATDMANLRNTIIPNAQEVDESNLELIKLCTASPNPDCDNTMVIIHTDCNAYPKYVATHIPSCDDSRLISYLITRGLVE